MNSYCKEDQTIRDQKKDSLKEVDRKDIHVHLIFIKERRFVEVVGRIVHDCEIILVVAFRSLRSQSTDCIVG
jgi:hypothetical protein